MGVVARFWGAISFCIGSGEKTWDLALAAVGLGCRGYVPVHGDSRGTTTKKNIEERIFGSCKSLLAGLSCRPCQHTRTAGRPVGHGQGGACGGLAHFTVVFLGAGLFFPLALRNILNCDQLLFLFLFSSSSAFLDSQHLTRVAERKEGVTESKR